MKDQKTELRSNNRVPFCTILLFTVVVATFGTLSFIQWRDIAKLNDRVTAMELERLIGIHKRNQDNLPILKHLQFKEDIVKDVYSNLFEKITKKQESLFRSFCSNHSNGCDSNDKVSSRDRRSVSDATSIFSKRQIKDYANSCCYHLAKPVLVGPKEIVVTANKDGDIILPCKPTGLPPAEVQWFPAVDPKQLGRYIQTVDGLLVTTTDFVDTSTFTCRATNVFGTVDKKIRLIVLDPIKVGVTPSTTQLNANQSVDFTCSFTGVPPPTVKWYHVKYNKQKELITSGISSSNQQSVLHIDRLNALSAGEYVCEVSNSFNNQSSSSTLAVSSKPLIINGPKTQLVNVGTTITLHCDVVSNPPATTAWTFPKTGSIPPKTASINPDGSVTLFHVDSFSEGQYTCTATNIIGSTTSSGTLNVNVPFKVTTNPHQKSVYTDESYVQLTCGATGGGQPTLSWSKLNSPPLSANPQKYLLVGDGLIITSVQLTQDTGVYVCRGTNGKQQGSDKVVLYKSVGTVNCTTTFSDCGLGLGSACGGKCTSTCATSPVYGDQRYTMNSSVCAAATHAGIPTNSQLIWTIINSASPFIGTLSNGITSLSSGPAPQEAHFYAQPATITPFG